MLLARYGDEEAGEEEEDDEVGVLLF